MMKRRIWAENLMLLKDCVEKSGGVLTVLSSYTSSEGDMSLEVTANVSLTTVQDRRYEANRVCKIDKDELYRT